MKVRNKDLFKSKDPQQTPTVDLEQESEKIPLVILKIKKEQAKKKKMLKFTIKSTNKVALKEYDQKSALYQTMHANKSFNRNLANHRLYHALMEELIEDENALDKEVADTVQDYKRKHDDDDDDDEDPPAGPNQGKKTKRRITKESESSKKPSTTKETPKGNAPSKGSKTGKPGPAKEPVEEPIVEVVMDDVGDDVIHDDDQPQDSFKPKTTKTLNLNWFTQPPKPATPDPKWNKRQLNKFSKHNVYSTKKILGVKSVSVKKLHGYGHLEEIVVKRVDHGTLKKVRDELHHIYDYRLEYNKEMPRRKWTTIDKKRPELMVELIDKKMRERRIIRNLKRLVGSRELEMNYKLMTRTT
nr:hypothetical protein [Tanacetum cinerariifolium]